MAGATYYHIILTADWIWPVLFRPKRDKLDSNTGAPIVSKYKKADGSPSNIPENNPVGKVLGAADGVFRRVTTAWTSDKERLGACEAAHKTAINAIKGWLNSKPTMVWYHGEGCDVNGKHLHIITHDVPSASKTSEDSMFDTVIKPQATYAYKAVRAKVNKAGGTVKLQEVINLVGLQSYLSKAGRIFFGSNKKYMLKHYGVEVWMKILNGSLDLEDMYENHVNPVGLIHMPGEEAIVDLDDDLDDICGVKRPASDDVFDDSPKRVSTDVFGDDYDGEEDVPCAAAPTKKPKGKGLAHKAITLLTGLIVQYGFTTPKEVIEYMVHSDSTLDTIVYAFNFEKWFARASDIAYVMMAPESMLDLYPSYKSEGTVGVSDALTLLAEWCAEQSIDVMEFVCRVYCVMARLDPKYNSMALIGDSNAGKSFWLKTIVPPGKDKVGIVTKSTTFMWQDCIDKELIVMEEALLAPELMETFKIVAGGQDTKVDVKMKAAATLKRTPVFIASNHELWKFMPEAQKTITNRVYIYNNLVPSVLLTSLNKRLIIDSQLWWYVFHYLQRFNHDMPGMCVGAITPPRYGHLWSSLPGCGDAQPLSDDVAFYAAGGSGSSQTV